MKAEFVRILSHVQSFFIFAHFPYSRLGSFFLQIVFLFVFGYIKYMFNKGFPFFHWNFLCSA